MKFLRFAILIMTFLSFSALTASVFMNNSNQTIYVSTEEGFYALGAKQCVGKKGQATTLVLMCGG